MRIYRKITDLLAAALSPTHLEITDDSEKHKGHGGYREGGETHFTVKIVSEKFSGLSRIERHKLVNSILKDELAGGVHALSINAKTPEEL